MKKPNNGNEDPWTILKLLRWATDYFNDKKIEDAKATAEILLAQSLQLRRIDLYLQYDRPLEKPELSDFKILLKRKLQREPVAYIVGHKEFWSMPLAVTPDVLIPRPETEGLVEATLKVMDAMEDGKRLRILELGTGSGALVIALASQKRGHHYYASDISEKALAVAKRNAALFGLDDIHLFAGDWMRPLAKRERVVDVVVSNPPYIPSRQIPALAPEIHRYEPLTALDGDEDGLSCLRHIVQHAWEYLGKHGWLLLEMGYDQKEDMLRIAEACGRYDRVEVFKDYGGHDRVIQMRCKE